MAGNSPSANLQTVLHQHCETIRRPRWNVLFRRGEKSSGMCMVLSGKVSLDFGVDSAPDCSCGPGALVGLSAAITGQNCSMTAIVTEDAELDFVNSRGLDSLLRQSPELCQELLMILQEKKATINSCGCGTSQIRSRGQRVLGP